MDYRQVFMARGIGSWEGNGREIKDITLCVTEDCNLACKYCYMTGKNSKKKMSLETAKKVVDYILNDRISFPEGAVVWNFIGGEPFLEIDLIDEISDYIKQQMFLLDHPWFDAYRFSFSTNGILYNTEKVQAYINKNRGHLSIGISVDGNKLKHDLQRVYPNGEGSYEDVIKNVPLWIKQFGNVQTKATYSHEDLPHIKDSIISLWDLGIKDVAANVIFEDVWHEGDDLIFETQLKQLADYVIENKLWDKYRVRFFDPHIGFPNDDEAKQSNFCGAGKMLAIDCDGNFYPCIRFLDFSLNNKNGINIGNYVTGINRDKVRPFYGLYLENQSTNECIDCEVATGCAWCSGYNYDNAQTDTIYERATHICKMHKANVRASEYFWQRYEEVTGEKSPRQIYKEMRDKAQSKVRYLMLITEDNIVPHCNYRNKKATNSLMDKEMIEKGISFAVSNGYIPVFLGNQKGLLDNEYSEYIRILGSNSDVSDLSIVIYDNDIEKSGTSSGNSTILCNYNNINKLYEFVNNLINRGSKRINIVLEEIEKWQESDIDNYREQLESIADKIVESFEKDNEIEVNVLTDRLYLSEHLGCEAGNDIIALAPNGKFYLCPAFYFDDEADNIGDINTGIKIKNRHLLELKNASVCKECDAYHCMRCKFLNKKLTGEINVPSRIQCLISNTERNITKKLQERLIELGYLSDLEYMKEIRYLDPMDKILNRNSRKGDKKL